MSAKAIAKSTLYKSGALSMFHRIADRHTLTVLMFHRVLPPSDPRYGTCEREWTLSESVFQGVIAFVQKHFSVVSMSDVVGAWHRGSPLPHRAALVTFDDGWKDNLEYAAPILKREGCPATVFVVAQSVGASDPYWEETVERAFRIGRLREKAGALLWEKAQVPQVFPAQSFEREHLALLLRHLGEMDPAARRKLLADPELDLLRERNMLDAAEIEALLRHGISIGSHGNSHVPLTSAKDPAHELRASRAHLETLVVSTAKKGDIAFSFPHGRYTDALARLALGMYPFVFTSDPILNVAWPNARRSRVLGRIHISEQQISEDRKRVSPERLALWLFFRARRAIVLAGEA